MDDPNAMDECVSCDEYANEISTLKSENERMRHALKEIKLGTSPYQGAFDTWPLAAGCNHLARVGLGETS